MTSSDCNNLLALHLANMSITIESDKCHPLSKFRDPIFLLILTEAVKQEDDLSGRGKK